MSEENKPVDKVYIGNGQEKPRQSGDRYIVGSLCVDDIVKIAEKHGKVASNGKKYIKVYINPYRGGANEHGNTHSFSWNLGKKEGEKF